MYCKSVGLCVGLQFFLILRRVGVLFIDFLSVYCQVFGRTTLAFKSHTPLSRTLYLYQLVSKEAIMSYQRQFKYKSIWFINNMAIIGIVGNGVPRRAPVPHGGVLKGLCKERKLPQLHK